MECGAWSENDELMNIAMPLCSDKEGLLYGNLANSRGCMETERGHAEQAYEYMEKSLEIRRRLLSSDHEEVGNSLNNFGNMILQNCGPGDCKKALEYYNDCIAVNMTRPKSHYEKFLHIPHTNIARALRVLKDYKGSIENAEKSRDYSIKFLGVGNHFHGL